MNEPKTVAVTNGINEQAVARLDEAVRTAALALESKGSFESAFRVADAMQQLRESITADMMKQVMSLQNTALGFKTDRGPKNPKSLVPYDANTVKECLIEAVLRGVQPIGNQFNIIASGAYITKEGYSYLLKKLPGFSDPHHIIGIPKTAPGGSIVPCSSRWKMNGKEDFLQCEIPVKINEFMGVDGIVGKATRKLLKRVYDQITGAETPDGDATEQLTEGQPAAPQPFRPPPLQAPDNPELEPMPKTATGFKTTLQPPPGNGINIVMPTKGSNSIIRSAPPQVDDIHVLFQDFLNENGFTFTHLQRWGEDTGNIEDASSKSSLQEIDGRVLMRLIKAKRGLLEGLTAVKGSACPI